MGRKKLLFPNESDNMTISLIDTPQYHFEYQLLIIIRTIHCVCTTHLFDALFEYEVQCLIMTYAFIFNFLKTELKLRAKPDMVLKCYHYVSFSIVCKIMYRIHRHRQYDTSVSMSIVMFQQ